MDSDRSGQRSHGTAVGEPGQNSQAAPLRVRLLPATPPPALPEPDTAAERILERAGDGGNLVVLGAPGTGKTTVAMRLLVNAVAAGREAIVLAPTRARADALRQRAAHLLGNAGGGAVRVRTPTSLALAILTTFLTHRPNPLPPPVLLAGAEEDAALAAMIRPEQWPGLPPETVVSRAFRSELRNLLARAGELGVDAEELAELAQNLDVPLWKPVSALLRMWDAQGRPSACRRSQTRKMDTARLQDRAVDALKAWEADDITEPPKVPDLVVVDDYQDCTAATARLLAALATPDAAGHRAQVIVLGDPDVAVETFRGGAPSLLVKAEAHSGLAADRLTLDTLHRGTPLLASIWADQADRIPVTGVATHRHPRPAPELLRTSAPGAPRGATALVASSAVQEAAHVARLLRAEHIHHATPWSAMAVITRSTARTHAVSRELCRRGVPLAASTPAVLLRAEPAAGAILDVARAALTGRLGQPGSRPQRAEAVELLTSPLIGLTPLDLRRLRRRLRADHPIQETPDSNLLSTLSSPQAADSLAERLACEPLAEQAGLLVRAARIIDRARAVVGDSVPQQGARPETTETENLEAGQVIDVEALLWAVWDASGCAQRWRTIALAGDTTTSRSTALLADAAEHDLDVVTALFKRAEVWAERHPGAPASHFLDELTGEVLPTDSVAPHGTRPDGVAVLTAAAAAGGHWDVVAVVGLNRDAWPDLRLRDSLTRTGLLVDAITGRLPSRADGGPNPQDDPASAVVQVRGDERRMLLAALTRARRRLIATAVYDADHAPSTFLHEIARAAHIPVSDAEGNIIVAPDVGDLTLRGLTGELRNALSLGSLPQATPIQQQRAAHAANILAHLANAGVHGADPSHWAGLTGPSSTAPLAAPGERIRISPSDVENLNQCPLRWFLRRNGGSTPPTGAQVLGTVIHALAERAEREHLRGAALTDAFEEVLPTLGYPPTWLGDLDAQRARDMVTRLDHYLATCTEPARVEEAITADLDLHHGATTIPVRVTGRIDRLEAAHTPQGERAVRVMDIKTGKKPARSKTDPARHPQLATYRLALEARGQRVDGGALILLGAEPKADKKTILLPAGAALAPSPDTEGTDWATELLVTAALAARGPNLSASTGDHCRMCPVKDSCPAQPEGRRTVA